ncbi:hypothetical protein SELMODRAFT_447811 [Selaginella moellendorffii]|uniref:DUF4005 domain-containing protein n=1 Tax=Selaginella moellendorffii TaxID=88036 RepID=D8T2F4_SELML|nr:protein IQ-DOMAIN 1 isoform X1 [Selaginella moellendorffii]XP_024519248.1 protein IQ-DOMAIN 1 isoform X1 [Selaginella moellendorffii]EFJ09197.1 hypothetical protein SELMODRAFT_447811 [Selaginella moellendorffii]|eukprot:XP_002989720.1 protein IQ-DOMAIN 1 isoform X1 [Selaginella moellendorffii]
MGGSQKLFQSLGIIKVKSSSEENQKKPKKAKGRKWKFWKSSIHATDDKPQVVVRKPDFPHGSQDWAAVVIQTAFRGYMARRTLRAIKGVIRLQALVRGRTVRKQASITLRCMQTLVKVQRARQTRLHEASTMRTITHRPIPTDKTPEKGWADGVRTKEEMKTRIQQKHEAAVKRERALAYAFSHQWRAHPRPPTKGAENPEWEWGWLERWMASRPWENHTVEEVLKNGVHSKSSVQPPSKSPKESECVDSPKSVQSNSKFQPTPASEISSPASVKVTSTPGRTTSNGYTNYVVVNGVEKPVVKSRYMNPRKTPGTPDQSKDRPSSLPKQRPSSEDLEFQKKRLSLPTPKIKALNKEVTTPTKSPVVTPKKATMVL